LAPDKQENRKMAIRFDTTQFRVSHCAEPKGRGSWMFEREASHGMPARTFTSPAWMTFTEARAWARKQVQAEGFQDAVVHVMP
jgi:hypothetical protein